jgi:UrcA family protein
MFIKSMLTAVAVLTAAGLAGPAAAQTSDSDPGSFSRRISFADLNLTNPAGAKALLRRIRSAAGNLCQPEWDDIFDSYRSYGACVKEATDTAVAHLGSPLVTALNGRSDQLAATAPVTPRS